VRRPRVRRADGREVSLETWERFAEADPLTPRAVEQMVLGVSTRNYARSIESAPPHVPTRGTSKSAVSRRFVAATREKLSEMMSRDLSGLAICATMIDDNRPLRRVRLCRLLQRATSLDRLFALSAQDAAAARGAWTGNGLRLGLFGACWILRNGLTAAAAAASLAAIRRPAQLGHAALALHENATSRSWVSQTTLHGSRDRLIRSVVTALDRFLTHLRRCAARSKGRSTEANQYVAGSNEWIPRSNRSTPRSHGWPPRSDRSADASK
jgi:hypothetical protein